jgi:hypothetical protein
LDSNADCLEGLRTGNRPHAEAKIKLSGTANVYLIVDQRATVYVNPVVNGWTATNWIFRVWESGGHTDRAFSVWVRLNQTGEVMLPIQGFHGAFNYFVIVD